MNLTLDEAINILEKQQKDPHLAEAVEHENRVKLHTEPTLEQPDNPAYSRFIKKVKDRIPDDAYDRFVSLIEYPFATVDYTEGVFSAFNKVFESSDRYINVSFKNPDYETDFKPYIEKVDKWFKEYGVNTLKTKFNSYVVVDLPETQRTERPEPYFYCLPSGNVMSVKLNRKNECEYIAFNTGDTYGADKKKLIAFFDDMHYRILVEKGNSYEIFSRDGIKAEVQHGLGWCPVTPFWSDILDPTKTMLNKKMPATNSLGRLDTLAFKLISKEYSDLYNLYPIMWSLPEAEDEERLDKQFGSEYDECADLDNPIRKNNSNSSKILTNPGRNVIKPLPNKEDGDVGDPAGFIAPPVENLEFIVGDLDDRKLSIQYSIAGKPGEPKNDQAKNEKQINAGFESEYTVLLNVATNFAAVEKWLLKTKAALRYGSDSIKEVNVNNGKNFFLHTHYEIIEEMELAKKVNMSPYILDQQEKAYIQTKYKSNPEKQERLEMMRLLTPYRQLTLDQVLAQAQYLDPEKVRLRIEFSDVLDAFETKFAPVESFMRADDEVEMEARINAIKEEFLSIIKRNNYVSNFGEPSNAIQGSDGQSPASQKERRKP